MDNQRVNHRRRNLPAELKVEIVDCLPLENAVHFLANVSNRLVIHHCAPRIRRIIKIIPQIAAEYARTLTPDSHGYILLMNGHKYTPEMDIFLRCGATHCLLFLIRRGTSDGFVGYPANFFDDLIKYYYETKVPTKAVHNVIINLSLTNPAPWPAALAGEMKMDEKVNNDQKCVEYILRNKHNPGIAFKVGIYFERGAKCYQQMTQFAVYMFAYPIL